MRIRRKKNTAEKLQDFLNFVTVESIGEEFKNNWRKIFGNVSLHQAVATDADKNSVDTTASEDFDEKLFQRELFVELGTGKGDFITALAEKYPEKNFLGLEMEREVVLKAARKIQEKNLKNVRLVVFDINKISEIFAENEIDRIYINFCDPWPKKRHAKRRLTHINFLEMYRKILKSGGEIHFKTDNRGLFDFSLEQFELAGLKISDLSFDLHANEPPENIRTEYENKFSALGSKINRCVIHF